MAHVLISEGTSGIVDMTGPGVRERYFPDNDLDATLDLMFQLYELRSADGGRFLDNYRRDGINWLSGQVGNIYWRWLFRHVQYAPLLERFFLGKLTPHFRNKVNLARIWELFAPPRTGSMRNWWRYRRTLPRHNRDQALKSGGGLYFYRYGPNDFRTRDMLGVFEKRGTDFTFVYSASKAMLKARAAQPHPVYFLHRNRPSPRLFAKDYDFSNLPPKTARLFAAIVDRAERNMSFQHWEYRQHLKALRPAPPKLFFGLDDHQEIHPVLYACRELGVPSVGYQLGMYARRQAAYVMEGWEPGSYQWYDNVIVWGPYWEEAVRRHGNVYPEGYFLPGTNKHSYGYNRLESKDFSTKNILVPYEFWGNTRLIGQYMMKLMDKGFTVHFKFKPDERPERQLDCYCLPDDYRSRIVKVMDISDELMARINIVAGGMTTLLYDLLPYGKATWVLDTEFTLLDDMVEDGLAVKMGMEDIEKMGEPPVSNVDVDAARLSTPVPLEEVLERHVLSRL